tara:strand:+ start:1030 stop:1167 length:138 start_codon:yes stop_codon:yes gene_type:complete
MQRIERLVPIAALIRFRKPVVLDGIDHDGDPDDLLTEDSLDHGFP